MSAEVLEYTNYELTDELEPTVPLVIPVHELNTEQWAAAEARRFIGNVATNKTVEVGSEQTTKSLYEAIHLAAEGDVVADKLVTTNAATDVIERTIKVGHIGRPVPLEVKPSGDIMQYGQDYLDVQANSLRIMGSNEVMKARTESETRNAFRKRLINLEGYFDKGYHLVVFSLAEDIPEAGFFTETMTCMIQDTYKDANGLARTPAFVAGVKNEGELPHDKDTIVKVGQALGVDWSNMTSAEIIDHPVLIHESAMPNGITDLVKLWDECAGGTFFGQEKPKQDYLEYEKQCAVREWTFEPKVKLIKEDLLAEAATITTPEQAIRRLHKISESHMVDKAIEDRSIDPRVFGPTASRYIDVARAQIDQGLYEQASETIDRAKRTAQSNSCPSAVGILNKNGEKDDRDVPKDEHGSLSFVCPKGHSNTRKRGKLLSKCRVCKVSVSCS
jgi:hypothetical protein